MSVSAFRFSTALFDHIYMSSLGPPTSTSSSLDAPQPLIHPEVDKADTANQPEGLLQAVKLTVTMIESRKPMVCRMAYEFKRPQANHHPLPLLLPLPPLLPLPLLLLLLLSPLTLPPSDRPPVARRRRRHAGRGGVSPAAGQRHAAGAPPRGACPLFNPPTAVLSLSAAS